MTKKAAIIGAVALMGAAYYLHQNSSASQAPDDETEYQPEDGMLASAQDWMNANIIESEAMNSLRTQMPEPDKNIAAMLYAISRAEGTAGQSDPYRVCFGYAHTIKSFSEHPAITGEWNGGKLSDALCAGAGLGPGCVSTAAGKFQIIKRTWTGIRDKLGLADFSPASQDAAAVELLRQRGALGPLGRGDFAGAVAAAKKEWASLPGAGYGQGERSIAWLTDRFVEAGGVLA